MRGHRKKNPLKKSLAKREIVFDAPKKSSRPSSLGVLILTSRPNSRETKYFDQFTSVSATKFYETPKSLLEKQYEKNLSRFLPTYSDTDFLPLDSESPSTPGPETKIEHPESTTDDRDIKDSEAAGASGDTGNNGSKEVDGMVPTEIAMSEEFLVSLCSDNPTNNDFHVAMLVRTADFFLEKAHSSVLDANDIQGTKVYFTYIQTALKALIMLVKGRTKLNLKLEVLVYYNIARIFFYETDELGRADAYINKALSLASRNNLTQIAVTCELLYVQILESSNPNLLDSFLTEKIASYTERGLRDVSDLFTLLRSTYLMVSAPDTGHVALQSLINATQQPIIRTLSTLYKADLQLYRGSPSSARELLSKLDMSSQATPIIGMYHLIMFASLILTSQGKAKKYMETVSDFISKQRANMWPDWQEDGSVSLNWSLNSNQIPFALQGLNSDEFVIMFYFLSGVLFMSERSGYKKANKVFSSCLEIIEVQLQELTQARKGTRNFSIRLLTGKIVRLNYVRYSVYYYRVWLSFMYKNDYSGIDFLVQFINNFDEENFTKEELCYYKLLMPRFLLLTAMYLQSQGDLFASKYYFLRVRHLCSSKNTLPPTISYLQRSLGIGCEAIAPVDDNSELFILATIHLLIITEFEIAYSKNDLAASRNYLADLYLDLSNTTSSRGFMFDISFKVLSCIYLNRGFDSKSEVIHDIETAVEKCVSGNFIALLARYVLYRQSLNLEQRNELLAKGLRSVSDRDDNGKMMKLLFLRESKLNSEEEEEILETQKAALLEAVKEKLARAKTSILV